MHACSIEFENFHGVVGWWDLSDVTSVYLTSVPNVDGTYRDGVALESEKRVRCIHVDESSVYAEQETRQIALCEILEVVLNVLKYKYYTFPDDFSREEVWQTLHTKETNGMKPVRTIASY